MWVEKPAMLSLTLSLVLSDNKRQSSESLYKNKIGKYSALNMVWVEQYKSIKTIMKHYMSHYRTLWTQLDEWEKQLGGKRWQKEREEKNWWECVPFSLKFNLFLEVFGSTNPMPYTYIHTDSTLLFNSYITLKNIQKSQLAFSPALGFKNRRLLVLSFKKKSLHCKSCW